jgi:peptidoglycan biosynthesis protein MviN/MurJ (putative lipid II flippase)
VNACLSLGLLWLPDIREAAFAISSCTTSGAAVVVGAWVLQRRTGIRIFDGRMLGGLARMLAAAAVAGLVVWHTQPLWENLATGVPRAFVGRALVALGPLAVGTVVFLACSWLLRLPEVGLLMPRRLRRKKGQP